MLKGIITKGIGGFYYVLADGEIYECKARGIFRKNKITPMVGDSVNISVKNGKGSIEEILPRKSEFIRPPVANVDVLVIVVASQSPAPNLMLIDKMLVQAELGNTGAIICINKTDLSTREDIVSIYENAGYKVICVSAEAGENTDELKELITGRVTAFTGLSGVGKSSLLNIITDSKMETGALSEKIERGKHTTRHVELLPVSGGFVLDTPGFSSMEIPQIPEPELQMLFPEIAELVGECKYRGCSHVKEEGCAVREAVAAGKIAQSRYESYCEFYKYLKEKNSY